LPTATSTSEPPTSTPLPLPTREPTATATLLPHNDYYQVIPGDSLWKLAGAAYRDSTKWPLIYQANTHRPAYLTDPRLIHPGVPLFIPECECP
jgi:nucleoid-associated protein YgaU